jgi:WhiB family redox-sensing transcriptional regulator
MNSDLWRQRAACLGMPANMFHVERGVSTRPAQQLCNKCPVKRECLEFILTIPGEEDLYGIYGGTNPKQRRAIRKNRKLEASSQ